MSTKIEWTDATWNPVTGCTKISPGCANCYAERMAKRLAGRAGYPPDDPFRVTLHPERLQEPSRWRKSRMVFVCSMGDLFHDDVPNESLDAIFSTIALRPRHTFQVLTKRPERMAEYFGRGMNWADRLAEAAYHLYNEDAECAVANSINGVLGKGLNVGWPMRNLWLGVTAENQEMADQRIPILLQIPAAVRFVSVEPMLGPVDLRTIRRNSHPAPGLGPEEAYDAVHGAFPRWQERDGVKLRDGVDWVICGGETGSRARPMHPDWARSLRDQCQAAGVPFFFKHMGEYAEVPGDQATIIMGNDGSRGTWGNPLPDISTNPVGMARVGKKAAGHLLDGKEWREMPLTPPAGR